MAANSSDTDQQTLLLLAVWFLGGNDVKKGDIMQRIVKSGETSKVYAPTFETLEGMGAIVRQKRGTSFRVTLQPQGEVLLGQQLQQPSYRFGKSPVRSWIANALLRWIREQPTAVANGSDISVAGMGVRSDIKSYEAFKTVVLEVYDQLNRDYNLDHLVPIYRIRREIGERVPRSQFNDWLLEMQSEDILHLLQGGVEDNAPDKLEDSITTKLGKLRCYARRLDA